MEHVEEVLVGEDELSRVGELEARNDVNFVRQRDWFDPQEHPNTKVLMVGAGGIGSPTAIALSKLGIPTLKLVDFDEVEAHNVPNQMYTMDHAGVSKVDALEAMCEVFGASEIYTFEKKGEELEDEHYEGIVVTGLDNMNARKAVWERVKEVGNTDFYIDARLGGQTIVIYAFDPKDKDSVEYYEQFGIFPQEEAVEAPCTAQSIIDVSFQVASLITRAVRMHVTGNDVPMVIQFNQENLSIVGT